MDELQSAIRDGKSTVEELRTGGWHRQAADRKIASINIITDKNIGIGRHTVMATTLRHIRAIKLCLLGKFYDAMPNDLFQNLFLSRSLPFSSVLQPQD